MEELFIGKVAHSEAGWSRLEPLATLVQGRWRVLKEVADLFPPNGRIFALPRAIPSPGHGSVWMFTRQANARAAPSKDKFMVDVASPAIGILDMSSVSMEQARHQLFEVGIPQLRLRGRDSIVLLTGGTSCILQFDQPIRGIRKAVPSLQPVNLMSTPAEWTESDPIEGQMYLPSMHPPSLPVLRRVNWCSDADFVSKILSRTRKYAQQLGDTKYAGPAKEGIQYIARALEQVGLFPGSPEDIELDLERLRAQWPALQAKLGAADEMLSMIMESRAAKEKLEQATREARELETARLRPKLEAEARAHILAELADKIRERDSVAQELTELTMQREAAQDQIVRLQTEAASARSGLAQVRSEIGVFNQRLRDSFERLPASEVSVTRALAENLTRAISAEKNPSNFLPPATAPWSLPAAIEIEEAREISVSELRARFESAARTHAIERDVLPIMHAFARAGELVLLTGAHAERAFAAYTSCVCGTRVYSMALDPSTIGLDDVWRAPGSLAPTPVAFAWNRAVSCPDVPIALCLLNLDASPFHLWLRSFARGLRSSARPSNLFVFATIVRTEGAAEAYPFREELMRWLVPVQPRACDGSALEVLSSVPVPAEGSTWIRMSRPNIEAAVKTEAFAVHVSEATTDAEVVLRAARLASAWPQDLPDHLLWDWVRSLSGDPADGLAACLRAGYESLVRLNHQR